MLFILGKGKVIFVLNSAAGHEVVLTEWR